MPKFPEVELGKFKHTKDKYSRHALPFTIAFVFSRNKGNFIVKGMSDEVEAWLENFGKTQPCFYKITYWDNGCRTSYWSSCTYSNHEYHLFYIDSSNKRCILRGIFNGEYKEEAFNFRRMPNKWIPEFDGFLVKTKPVEEKEKNKKNGKMLSIAEQEQLLKHICGVPD